MVGEFYTAAIPPGNHRSDYTRVQREVNLREKFNLILFLIVILPAHKSHSD